MYLKSCAIVLVCVTLSALVAAQDPWPLGEWQDGPYRRLLSRFLGSSLLLQSNKGPRQVKVQESMTVPPTVLPLIRSTPPTAAPLLAHLQPPSGSDLCKTVICPQGWFCHQTATQCRSPPCPLVAECRAYDEAQAGGVCSLRVEGGNCSEQFQQWHWDSQGRVCKPFVYTGCNGNANRFPSLNLCRQICDRRQQLCRLAPETGMCRAAMPRWFYSVESGSCQQFIYGGCNGNSNNFLTQAECSDACTGV